MPITSARMFPVKMPPWIVDNPLRAAERKVYDRLRLLPAGFTVYYSRPWLGLTHDGREIDGEADFVIAHPEQGFLVLEVKGGQIAYAAATDSWTSTDRHGIEHPIKSPVAQARQSKYQLLKKLAQTPGWQPRHINAAYGVVFPDVANVPADLGADMPVSLFAWREHLASLTDWVETRLYTAAAGRSVQALGASGIDLLDSLIAASFTLHAPLAAGLSATERQIITLTEQQYQVLDGLSRNPRCIVSGGAGTGKTMLAIEKARRLAREGQRVLLTCSSRPLADYIRAQLNGITGIDALAFSEIPLALAKRKADDGSAGASPSESAERIFEWLKDAGSDALYDAVVVDEGQDLSSSAWAALELCQRTKAGQFYVFCDDNQRLNRGTPAWPAGLVPYGLSRNLRNTQPLCALSLPHYAGPGLIAAGPVGRTVEWVEARDRSDSLRKLNQIMSRLLGPDEMKPEDIVLLAAEMESPFSTTSEICGVPLVSIRHGGPGKMVFDTVKAFKGLERALVVLLNPEDFIDDPETMYTALTRARSHLIVIGTPESMALMRQLAEHRPSLRKR